MTEQTTQPNIVLIVSDDHGRDAFGAYGNPIVQTPNLDALAADGVRFDSAFCTTASCAASRSVLLTGLHNHTNRTFGHTHAPHSFALAEHIITLPAYLRAAGYRTGRVGKKHYRPERLFPFDWDPPELEPDAATAPVHDGDIRLRDDVAMADSCVPFIQTQSPGPFFLYYCSFNPHRRTARPYHHLQPDDFGNPIEPFPGDTELLFDPADVIVPPYLEDTEGTRAELAEYYQSINRLDRGIGRLLGHLAEAGVMDNTVIVYLSDNGSAFPVAKTTLYDPGTHLPLIVRSPFQSERGLANNALVNWTDITPTLLDFAGSALPPTEQFLGKSLQPILDQTDPQHWRDELFFAHSFHEITNYYPMRAIRTQTHKFIYNVAHRLVFPSAQDLWNSAAWRSAKAAGNTLGAREIDAYLERPMFELYDLTVDPNEVVNLAYDPGQASAVAGFVERLKDYQNRTGDPWLHKWDYE